MFRVASTLALWWLVAVVGTRAYMSTVRAAALDARLSWALPICVLAMGAGLGLGWALERRARPAGERKAPFGWQRHGLSWLAALLCAAAMAHVAPQTSLRTLREEVPPALAFVHPALAFVVPLLLRLGARRAQAADQALMLVLGLLSLSGALLLLDAPTALALALLALLLQIAAGGRLPNRSPMATAAGAVVLLLAVATALGSSRLHGQPSMTWIAAGAALALATAWRPRDRSAWVGLLSMPVAAAGVIALCDVVLTLDIAARVTNAAALQTRFILFRQHPNFLAPFYAFHALLAIGIAVSVPRRAGVAWLTAALLVFGTWHTDSNTGGASLLLGLGLLPGLYVLRALQRRLGGRAVAAGLAAAVILGLAGGWFVLTQRSGDGALLGIDRFEKSLDYRADAWRNSALIIERAPWIGIGPGTFVSVERFRPGSRFANEPQAPHPHNMFLYVAQSAGLLALAGLVIWLALLVACFWRAFGDDDGPAPFLVASLLAALGTLLFANLFDLSMALESVIPWPFFLLTGLALAQRARAARGTATSAADAAASTGSPPAVVHEPSRPAVACAGLVLLAVPLWQFAVKPIRAQTLVEQAQLLAFEAGRAPDRAERLALAQDRLQRALRLDPTARDAHQLLARWLESTPAGFADARRILEGFTALAPDDALGHSLLGHLHKRAGLHNEAAQHLAYAVESRQGGDDLNRDRADRIWCLTRVGKGSQARELLLQALRLDRGVIGRLPWVEGTDGGWYLPILEGHTEDRLALFEVIDELYANHLADQEAGQPVGRRFWMDTYNAYFDTRQYERAREVLDYLETHVADEVEAHSIENERAILAHIDGDLEGAIAHFERAYELSDNTYFRNRARELQAERERQGSADDGAVPAADAADADGPSAPAAARLATDQLTTEALATDESLATLESIGGVLDYYITYGQVYASRAEALQAAGHPAASADALESTLLFEDDILARARILLRVGELRLEAGDHAGSVDTLTDVTAHLTAKPYPYEMLKDGHFDSLPAHAARLLWRAWRGLGLDPDEALARAWKLPRFSAQCMGASLLRAGLFAQAGRADALMREAELMLLARPDHMLALWMRLFALEALGRHGECPMAMRAIIEEVNRLGSAERLFDHLVARMEADPARQADPEEWFQVGMANLLRGRYAEAGGIFLGAVERAPDDEAAGRYLGWQARAMHLAGEAVAAKALLAEAVTRAPTDALLRLRLETMP